MEKEFIYLVGIIFDIFDWKKVDKLFCFLDFMIESIFDGIFWIDKDVNFIWVNKVVSYNLGYILVELKGMFGKDINLGFLKKKL